MLTYYKGSKWEVLHCYPAQMDNMQILACLVSIAKECLFEASSLLFGLGGAQRSIGLKSLLYKGKQPPTSI